MVGVRYDCDECGAEMLRADGTVSLTSLPLYPHACENGHEARLTRTYPGWNVAIHDTPQERAILDKRRRILTPRWIRRLADLEIHGE